MKKILWNLMMTDFDSAFYAHHSEFTLFIPLSYSTNVALSIPLSGECNSLYVTLREFVLFNKGLRDKKRSQPND